jgi:hypothetical protein
MRFWSDAMKRKPSPQLPLPFADLPPLRPCRHESQFVTQACVPAGICCFRCGTLLSQFIPRPPADLGYVSADWAWHYRDGKEWTTL